MDNWVQAMKEVSQKYGRLSDAFDTWQDTKRSEDAYNILCDCRDLTYDLCDMEKSHCVMDDICVKKNHIQQVVSDWLQQHPYEPPLQTGSRKSS